MPTWPRQPLVLRITLPTHRPPRIVDPTHLLERPLKLNLIVKPPGHNLYIRHAYWQRRRLLVCAQFTGSQNLKLCAPTEFSLGITPSCRRRRRTVVLVPALGSIWFA